MKPVDLELLSNEKIPESIRAELARAALAAETADADRALERERLLAERRKFLWNTPVVAALAGLVTLSATFVFDRYTARDATQQTITLEEVRQELSESNTRLLRQLEQEQVETEAEIAATAREREFQYDIVKAELTDSKKTSAERAAVLLFLVRAGVLNTLNRPELEEMAQRQIDNPDDPIIPQLTVSTVLPGIIGPDDAKPVTDFAASHPVHRYAASVGLFQMVKDGKRFADCTAFLIAQDKIATADHCRDTSDAARFVLQSGTRGETGHDVDLQTPQSRESSPLGYVVLTISPPAPARFQPLATGSPPDQGQQLGTIYYRGSGGGQLAVWGGEACRLFGIERMTISHSCDTGRGSSGAPVFDFESGAVIGVEHSRGAEGGIAYRIDSR